MSRQVTFSQLERLRNCSGSMALPWKETTSEAAERGTRIHNQIHWALYDAGFVSKPETTRPDVLEPLSMDALFEKAKAYSRHYSEMPIALMWGEDRASPPHPHAATRNGRAYSIGPNTNGLVLFGTPDLVMERDEDGGSIVEVVDYKTGHADLGQPSQSLQLLSALAWCLAQIKVPSKCTCIATYAYIRDGEFRFESEQVPVFDIVRAASVMRAIVEKALSVANGETPTFNPGGHCTYCPAFDSCPSNKAIVKTIESGDAAKWLVEINSQTAPVLLSKLEQAELVMKRLWKEVEEFAAHSPFVTLDGQTFGKKQTSRESIRGEIAVEVLGKKFGYAIAAAASETSITKTSLKQAISKHVPKGQAAETLKAAMEALREVGAIETTWGESIGRLK